MLCLPRCRTKQHKQTAQIIEQQRQRGVLTPSIPSVGGVRLGGKLPLHIACEHNARPEVLMFLLNVWPEAAKETDDRGMTPLHYAAAALYPYAASPDISSSAAAQALQALHAAHPSAAQTPCGTVTLRSRRQEEAGYLGHAIFDHAIDGRPGRAGRRRGGEHESTGNPNDGLFADVEEDDICCDDDGAMLPLHLGMHAYAEKLFELHGNQTGECGAVLDSLQVVPRGFG